MDARTKAIVSHITIIGWIVALVINNSNKESTASFYLRQTLGLYLCAIVASVIPFIGPLISLVVFVFWLLSLIYAIQDQEKEIPFVGKYFQEWFKAL